MAQLNNELQKAKLGKHNQLNQTYNKKNNNNNKNVQHLPDPTKLIVILSHANEQPTALLQTQNTRHTYQHKNLRENTFSPSYNLT